MTIQMRCGYADYHIVDPFIKEVAEPLKHIIQKIREGLLLCEKTEGFATLCSQASQRLFYGGYLLPEFEGVVRGAEPDPVMQPQDDLNILMATAVEAQRILRDRIDNRPWDQGMRIKPCTVPVALFAYDPGVKPLQSARSKASVLHGPTDGPKRYRNLLDLARICLVFPNCDMLQAGLDLMVKQFDDIVGVTNRFATPARIGARWIEVHIVVQVPWGNGRMVPHVCEIRLEHCDLWDVQKNIPEQLEPFDEILADKYTRASRDTDCIIYLAHKMLMEPANDHGLRVLRCKMANTFGSTTTAWRRFLGGGRVTSFKSFRELCHGMKCGEQATKLWIDMDHGQAGNISFYDLDPEAASLLVRVRSRLLALLHGSHADAAYLDDNDGEILFARICYIITPKKKGFLDIHEFRTIMKSLGFSTEDSDKAFNNLDCNGGAFKAPPALISKSDIAWLRRINTLFDSEASSLSAADKPLEEDYLRVLCSGLLTPRRTIASQQAERWAFSISSRNQEKTKRTEILSNALQTAPRTSFPGEMIEEECEEDLDKAALNLNARCDGTNVGCDGIPAPLQHEPASQLQQEPPSELEERRASQLMLEHTWTDAPEHTWTDAQEPMWTDAQEHTSTDELVHAQAIHATEGVEEQGPEHAVEDEQAEPVAYHASLASQHQTVEQPRGSTASILEEFEEEETF